MYSITIQISGNFRCNRRCLFCRSDPATPPVRNKPAFKNQKYKKKISGNFYFLPMPELGDQKWAFSSLFWNSNRSRSAFFPVMANWRSHCVSKIGRQALFAESYSIWVYTMHCNSIKSAPPKSSRIHTSMALWARICQPLAAYCSDMSLFGNAGRDAYFGQHLMKMSFEDVFGLKINPMNGSTAYKTLRNVLQTKNSSISNLRWKLLDFQSLNCISFLSTAEPISSSPSKHLRQVSTVGCRDYTWDPDASKMLPMQLSRLCHACWFPVQL